MIERAHGEAFLVHPVNNHVLLKGIETHEAILGFPGQSGFLIWSVSGELKAPGNDDHARMEVKRAPFHRSTKDNCSVFGFEETPHHIDRRWRVCAPGSR